MQKEIPTSQPVRVLVVGRSPSVLVAAVDQLRARGHHADATNQFDDVLDTYDVTGLDVLVFGGMIPAETKQKLHNEITERNPDITFVQGLAGIPGVIAAQVDEITSDVSPDIEMAFRPENRTIQIVLPDTAQLTIDALWMTSWKPPEPTSTSLRLLDAELSAGPHDILIPDTVPSEASFIAITVDNQVRVLTIGPLPQAVTRMVPKSATDRRLPDVANLTTSDKS